VAGYQAQGRYKLTALASLKVTRKIGLFVRKLAENFGDPACSSQDWQVTQIFAGPIT